MAKHTIDGKGKVSKGIRTSCYGLKRNSKIVSISDKVKTGMREAFENAKVSNAIIGSKLVVSVINSIQSKLGIHPIGRGWTASLSLRTFKQLKKEGVFA